MFELYYFEISIFKISDVPLHLEFLVRFDVKNFTFWANNSCEYLYDEGYPKEFFFNNTVIESTSQESSIEKEYRRLEEERKLLEEECNRHKEECKHRQ
ncbi:28893_t:CDS:2 [Dentiscutata erythropus]|uniref:28893_t:CDS:1 n=1 Tax=Dentiscutata erythropus TaxID=1348616 RepID=A0A9N9IRT0_9GLOM|nr:28893_t:CDS:2 [Dentiscutata erythropus]